MSYIPKINDIVYINTKGLCRIHDVEITKNQIFKRKYTGLFSSEKIPTNEFTLDLESVTVEQLGNNTGLLSVYRCWDFDDWKRMRLDGIRILNQIKFVSEKDE